MDERPPRQPDSSEPPEDSADTGAEERPRNPYRIPQRPPESAREETGGFSYERPARKDEDPATSAWDNPFRGGAAPGDEGGPATPWGAPVPGDVSPAGEGPSETMGSEDSWDTGTPWGAPVPGEEPRTSAFGSVGASDETPVPEDGQDDAADAWGTSTTAGADDAGDAWDAPEAYEGHHDPAHIGGDLNGTESARGATNHAGDDTSDARSTGAVPSGTWDTGRTSAFETHDEPDARDTWGTHAPSSSLDSGADAGDDASFGGRIQDTWGPGSGGHGVGAGWDTGTVAHAAGSGSAPESDAPDAYHRTDGSPHSGWGAGAGAVGARGWSESSDTHDNTGDTWDTGTTGEAHGSGDAWKADSGSRATEPPGPDPYEEPDAGDAWGTSGSEHHSAWGTGAGDAWGTPTSDPSQNAPGWGATAYGDQRFEWGAGAGAAGARAWSENSDTHDDRANAWDSASGGHDAWGTDADDAGHTWGTDARDDRGAADTWGGTGPAYRTHEAWNTDHSHGRGDAWGHPGPEDPGPSTAAFGSVGDPDAEEHQYGSAHGEGWASWGDENDEVRGSGQNAAWGAGDAWGASSYRDSGGTEFYGAAHSGDGDWDDPYRGQPAHQGDTPYPGGPVRPPVSEDYEYLYSGARAGGHGGYDDYDGYDADHGAGPGPDEKPPGKSRKGLLIGVGSGVLVLALIGGAIGWYVWQMPEPEEATAAFASSWENQDYEALAETTRGDDAAEILGGIDAGLGVDSIDVNVGQPSVEGGEGSASYEVTVSLTNADDWGWEGELPLVREDGEWWIDFSPEVAYPGLGEGQVLARTAVWGERGHILAADGSRLDTPEVSGSLQMIAGSLGEADEDDIERLGPAYSVGDTIGVDGLQRTHEEHLAGEAATTIVMVDAEEAQGEGSVEATEENTVATLDGSDGEDITTSIDPNVQNTAASAIMGADDPAGLVALRPSSGEILAAVNVPGGFNRAFEGQYPPGSAFKIVSYSALLDNGLSTDATMDCPEEYDLGGWPFRNAGEAEYGTQSVTEAFATSCNTALVAELGDRVSGEQLQASAEQFGMNQPLDIGVTTHEPVFPAVDSATMLGSQGIGQGQILTSPLHMATLPAAIADGSWRHPVLVNDPEPADLPEPTPIANAEAIRPMMRAVITDGTAKDLDFQGEVFGKTGTAEFGTAEDADEDDELPSHAWMVGYKGDVAFAVVVDGGGGGSSVAGPLAESFANGLP